MRRAYLALIMVLLVLCTRCEAPRGPVFPHRAHLVAKDCGKPGQNECPTCKTCHNGLRTSDKLAIAPLSECARCHTPATDKVRAETARLEHTTRAAEPIAFAHAAHLVQPEIRGACVPCHAGATKDGASGAVFPPMSECTGCHRHDAEFTAGECVVCHSRSDIRQRVPRTLLRHDLEFIRDHRDLATRQAKACAACHAQAECTACHDDSQYLSIEARKPNAIDRELVHRGEYLSRHAIEARSRPSSCLRCHAPSSCDSCHVERGVSASRVGSTSPHPIGWVSSGAAGPSGHARGAHRDLVSCAGCHEQGPATNCIRCHRVGGYGGNPHPAGWKSARAKDAAMCGYCHAP